MFYMLFIVQNYSDGHGLLVAEVDNCCDCINCWSAGLSRAPPSRREEQDLSLSLIACTQKLLLSSIILLTYYNMYRFNFFCTEEICRKFCTRQRRVVRIR